MTDEGESSLPTLVRRHFVLCVISEVVDGTSNRLSDSISHSFVLDTVFIGRLGEADERSNNQMEKVK